MNVDEAKVYLMTKAIFMCQRCNGTGACGCPTCLGDKTRDYDPAPCERCNGSGSTLREDGGEGL